MQFRLEEARRDGHDDASIASYLAQRHNFDIDRARADGADDAQIAEFLAARPFKATPSPEVGQEIEAKPEKGLIRRGLERVSDAGLDLAKGVVGTGEAVVGVANLLSGNAAGNALASIGYDPKATKDLIDSGYSEARQAENKAVQDAEGFVDTTAALLANPAAAVGSIIESAPLMLGSAGAVRAVAGNLLARAGIAPGTAAAQQFLSRPDIVAKLGTIGSVAEGATAAGSIQEQARQEGRSYSDSAPYALAGGAGTAVIGKAASRLLPDADVAAGTVGLGAGRTSVGQAAAAIGKGVVQEGIVEELPQSAQEQVMTNLATGKPWDESVGKAAAQGMVAGMGTGAGANAANQLARINPALDAELTQREQDAAATGDPLEVSVVRLENDVLRASEIKAHSERLLAAGIEGAPSIIDTIDPATRLEVARALMASLNPETAPVQLEVMGSQETASAPSPDVAQFRATVPTQEEVQDVPKAEQVDGKAQEAGGQEGAIEGFATRGTEILAELGRRGSTGALYKAAGVRTADAFADLPVSEKDRAYLSLIAGGERPVEHTESYNDKVMREEREILSRQMQGKRSIRQQNGKPFKTEASADQVRKQFSLEGTHTVEKVDGGFELRLMTPAAQAEARRIAEGRESYMEARDAVLREMGIGEDADGEIDATDAQWDEIDRRVEARMQGAQPTQAPTARALEGAATDQPAAGSVAGTADNEVVRALRHSKEFIARFKNSPAELKKQQRFTAAAEKKFGISKIAGYRGGLTVHVADRTDGNATVYMQGPSGNFLEAGTIPLEQTAVYGPQPTQAPTAPEQSNPAPSPRSESAQPDISPDTITPNPAPAQAKAADMHPDIPTPMVMSNGQPFQSQKLAAESARQRKLQMAPVEVDGGWGLVPTEMPQAQALQPDIPAAPVTPEAAPVQAPQADMQQDAPVTRSAADVTLDAPMLMSSGKPFGSQKLAAASARQRKLDMVPVKVEGGWGLAPARAQATNTKGPVPPITRNAAPAVAPVTNKATREALRTVAAARMPSLGNTVDRLITRGDARKRGGLVVVETEADLPNLSGGRVGPVASRGADGRIRGLYDPDSGLHYLVSENVDATEALAVLLHEATHGQQRAQIDGKAARMLESRGYYPAPVRAVLDRVAQRMEAASETGNPAEATAYIVEESVIAGRQAGFSAVDGKFMTWVDNRFGKRIGELVRDFVAMVRAWAMRRNVPLYPTLDDLVALAQYGLKRAEKGDVTFGEENRRLREENRTAWVKAKALLRRQLAPGGLLPENVFHEKVARDNQLNALEFDIRHIVGGLEQAVWKDFGKRIEKMSETEQAQITEALAGRVPASLPEATKTAILAMRQYIDGLSAEYVQILDEQITAKLNQGEEADTGLRDRILSNVGQYVNRSYRAFDDPQWFKKVPDSVLSNARAFLRNGYLEAGETEAEAARLTEVALHEILKNGTAYDSMESFIAEGKLGAKDLSVLMPRKNVPDELRALLGEHTDPRLTFAKSASKMGRLIWNQRFLDRVREVGMGAFLFEGMNRPPEATTQIAAEGSETYSPLNGLWTFPEVAQAFKDALGKEQMADWYRVIVRLNGMVKYGKTVLSPTTAMRNWQSAMFFSLANGHFNLLQMRKSVAAFREQVTQNATGDNLAYLRHLKTLGVVYDSPYAGEMKRLLDDSQIEDLLNTSKGTLLRGFRKANSVAQGFYSFGDDFWKIIGFENEKASLVKAGFSPQEAEVEAARRIRDTYPTYSLIGRAIRSLGRFPLAGTFVSFPAEIIRTTGNMLALVASDLRSDNPGLRRLGVRRALGMAMVSGGFYALSAISKAGAGVDDDEEEALRDLAPPWQKNSTFLYVGRDEDGKLRYFDMSFLDPYGYLKRPLTAMMRNQPWEKIAASSVGDLLSPFLGADISAEAVYRVFSNTTATGGKVYQEGPGVSPVDQTLAIADYLRKALQPGFMGNIERITQAAQGKYREGSGQRFSLEDEMVALLGWRASTVDAKTALRYRSYEFSDRLSDARGAVNRVLRSQNEVTDDDITQALKRGEAMHRQSFEEMRRIVAAARNSGMTEQDVREVLEAGSLSRKNVDALIRGEVPPFTVSEQAAQGAARQAELTRDKAHADEIKRRFEAARDLTQ